MEAICEAHERDGAACTKPATLRIHWPGRSLVMCDEHARAAKRVADAMGFGLTFDSLIDGLRVVLVALALVGCGPDAFVSIGTAPDARDEDATDIGQTSPEASDDGPEGGVEGGTDGAVVDVEAGADAAAVDSGEVCPMIGASCAPPGLRKCRGLQLVWYCAGTWTSNACTQNNSACAPCDAGYCCVISPVCP